MNIFTVLPQYNGDKTIENSNQLRSAKKKLKKLKEKAQKNKGELSLEEKKLQILINEYVNKDKYNRREKKKDSLKNKGEDDDFLNKEYEKMKIIKKNLAHEEVKYRALLKKGEREPNLKWKAKHNMTYPISFRITIVNLFCIHNTDGSLLKMLHKDVLIYILESNISWNSFPSIPNEKMILRNYN